jgi:hypothetical protein
MSVIRMWRCSDCLHVHLHLHIRDMEVLSKQALKVALSRYCFALAQRTALVYRAAVQAPGPADYDVPCSIGHKAAERSAQDDSLHTSSFATKVLRQSQVKLLPSKATPGPGEYFSRYQDAIRAVKAQPKEHQFFNSTQRRGYEIEVTQLRSTPTYLKGPGPGAYKCSSSFGKPPLADPACSAFSSSQVHAIAHNQGWAPSVWNSAYYILCIS